MYPKRAVYVVLAVVITLIGVTLFVKRDNGPTEPNRQMDSGKLQPTAIVPNSRIWISGPIDEPTRVHLDSMLFTPFDVDLVGGDFYISDYPTKVLRFDSSGRFINRIISGSGSAPGELLDYNDIEVIDRFVYVVGTNSRVISKYSINGVHIENYPVSFLPSKIFPLGDSLIVSGVGAGSPLHTLSLDGKTGLSFGDLIAQQGSALETIGRYAQVDDETFVYASYRASYLIWLDRFGNAKRILQTFGKRPFPGGTTFSSDKNVTVFKAPDQAVKVFDLEENNGLLWVSTIVGGEPTYTIYDAYNALSGEYIASQRVNKKLLGFDVGDDEIFAASDTSIVKIDISKIHTFIAN